MKVYCGKNRKGVWKASLDEKKLEKFEDVFCDDVDVIHNHTLYMIQTYYGIDYGYDSINDVKTYVHKLFHSVSAAKKNHTWRVKEQEAKETPEKFHVTPFLIASDDFGHPFTFGSADQNMFRMDIIRVKVI